MFDKPGLEDIEDGLHPLFTVGRHDDRFAAPVDARADVFEVVTLGNFLASLVQRVVDFLPVDLADNVKRRSEEHTSELQSRGHLVCRLLLEKKNARRCQASCSLRRTDSCTPGVRRYNTQQ